MNAHLLSTQETFACSKTSLLILRSGISSLAGLLSPCRAHLSVTVDLHTRVYTQMQLHTDTYISSPPELLTAVKCREVLSPPISSLLHPTEDPCHMGNVSVFYSSSKEVTPEEQWYSAPPGGLFPQVSICTPGNKLEKITPKVIRGSKTPGSMNTTYAQK